MHLSLAGLITSIFMTFSSTLSYGITSESLPQPEWNEIAPGGLTTCARGQPFSFFVRNGDPEKIVIDFVGGGACWDGVSCAADNATFTDSVDGLRNQLHAGPGGIYDSSNPENPYHNWTHVVVPYCTGDLHWGNNTKEYTDRNGQPFTIQHKGAVNSVAVLDWVKGNYPQPPRVHVTGCSAGSYGSILWAPYIQEQYPHAAFTQFGEAGAGVMVDGFMNVALNQWNITAAAPRWVPGLNPDDTDYSKLQLSDFYSRIGRHYPDARYSQYNSSFDFVQSYFYVRQGGRQVDWNPKMRNSLELILAQTDNFNSFIGTADGHCATVDDDFYAKESDGVRLSDWLGTYLSQKPVSNVDCGENCE